MHDSADLQLFSCLRAFFNYQLLTMNSILRDPRYQFSLELLKGLRNGLVYGAKVRFPHALVMTFLFRSSDLPSFTQKLQYVFKLTKEHSLNLATFVFLYKLLSRSIHHILAKNFRISVTPRGKYSPIAYWLAGLIGGYWVFGRNNGTVNQQIVLYLFSRILSALFKIFVHKMTHLFSLGTLSTLYDNYGYAIHASVVWAFVMWLFEEYPENLQSSLRSSMQYLYKDSSQWDSLFTLLIFNK